MVVMIRLSSQQLTFVFKPLIPAFIGITILTVLAFVEFFVESFGGRPFPAWLYFAIAMLACTPLISRFRLKELPIRLFLCSLVLMVATYFGKHGLVARKPFLQTLYTVTVGMSEAEVDQIMSGYIQVEGTQQAAVAIHPDASSGFTGTRLYRRPTQGPANDADRGIVQFRDGQVTGVDFSPD